MTQPPLVPASGLWDSSGMQAQPWTVLLSLGQAGAVELTEDSDPVPWHPYDHPLGLASWEPDHEP